jgi:hypothetical protein
MTIIEIFVYVLKKQVEGARRLQGCMPKLSENLARSWSVCDQTIVVNTELPLRGIVESLASALRGLHQRHPSSMVLQIE